MAVQRGRSERRGEAYTRGYVESLSDVRTKLADTFSILIRLERRAGSYATFVRTSLT
jgi:hypothetical protein